MYRMTTGAVSALQPAAGLKQAPGVAPRPAHLDHVHSVVNMSQVLFTLTGDMNVLTDQAFTKLWNFGNYLIQEIRAYDPSVDLTAADGGIYAAAAKAGDPLVAAAQIYTALSQTDMGLSLTLTAESKDIQTATPILALTGTQGGAATCKFIIIGIPLTEGA